MSDYPYSFNEQNEIQEMQEMSPYQNAYRDPTTSREPTAYMMHHNPPMVHSNPNLRRQDAMLNEPVSPSPFNPFNAAEFQKEHREYKNLIDGIMSLQAGMSHKSVDRVQMDRIIIPASMLTPKQIIDYNNDEVINMKKKYLAQLQNIPNKIIEELDKAKADKANGPNVSHTVECYKRLREWAQSWIDRLISESSEGYYWNAVAIKNFHEQYMS